MVNVKIEKMVIVSDVSGHRTLVLECNQKYAEFVSETLRELTQRPRGSEVEHEAHGLEDLFLVRIVPMRVFNGP